jgi:uncharacterized protein (TIGR02246 family)
MFNSTKLKTLVPAAAVFKPGDAAQSQAAGREHGVTKTLKQYQTALNASDTEAVIQLYTQDGVFMPQQYPPAIGAEAVRGAYGIVFATIKLNVTFDIVEVVQVAPDWAFARTNSAGTVSVLANGEGAAEYNKELFIMRRVEDGDWKIARYAFSATNPPSN